MRNNKTRAAAVMLALRAASADYLKELEAKQGTPATAIK